MEYLIIALIILSAFMVGYSLCLILGTGKMADLQSDYTELQKENEAMGDIIDYKNRKLEDLHRQTDNQARKITEQNTIINGLEKLTRSLQLYIGKMEASE